MSNCLKLQVIQTVAKDGSVGEIHRCKHVSAEAFAQDVTNDVCNGCIFKTITDYRPPNLVQDPIVERDFGQPKLLKDGTLVYKRQGFEPPPPHNGYRRKSEDIRSDDAWVFVPIFLPCRYRTMVNGSRPCGCIQINHVCVHSECKHYRSDIDPGKCAGCPLRQE